MNSVIVGILSFILGWFIGQMILSLIAFAIWLEQNKGICWSKYAFPILEVVTNKLFGESQ